MHSSRRNNQGNSISNTCHCQATLTKSIVTMRHYWSPTSNLSYWFKRDPSRKL